MVAFKFQNHICKGCNVHLDNEKTFIHLKNLLGFHKTECFPASKCISSFAEPQDAMGRTQALAFAAHVSHLSSY